MKYFLFFVACFFYCCQLFAQLAPNLSNNIAGSSEVTAMSKAANIPVNYYTGTPGISIPIFNYTKSGISANVSIDYAAGGIKVAEEATNVGLGWHVNAGGLIARSLRGLPDDCPGRGFMYTPGVNFSGPKRPTRPGNTPPVQGYYSIDAYYKDSIDSQCDIYQFSFNGRSGEFIIGKDKKVLLLPESKLKVKYNTGAIAEAPLSSITSFTIVTEEGINYVFSEKEITRRSSGQPYNASLGYVTAWHLKQIIAPFGVDTITFQYKDNVTTSARPMVASRIEDGESAPIANYPTENIQITKKDLSQIIMPYNLRVEFNYYNFKRCDANLQSAALKSIEIRDTLLRNGYQFNYKYFTETAGKEYSMDGSSCASDISKLKLESILPYTQFGQLPGYLFSYSSLGVPKSTSKSQDYWGFFNNKPNTDLFPPAGSLGGADRNPDAVYVKAGSLSSIQYPNGGKVVFDFELNDAGVHYYTKSMFQLTGPRQGTSATIYLSRVNKPITLTVYDNYQANGCYLNYTLKNSAGVIVDQFSSPESMYQNSLQRQLDVPTGNYTLSWEKAGGSCPDEAYSNYSVSWTNQLQDIGFQQLGGLRIRQITLYDKDPLKAPLIRQFNYKNENGSSSGILMSKPEFSYRYDETWAWPNAVTHHYYTVRLSEPMNNQNYVGGNIVGYNKVDEIIPNNGKTSYEYSTYIGSGYFPPIFSFPYADLFVPKWLAGLPIRQSVFDINGKKQFQTENIFDFSYYQIVDTLYKSVKLNVAGNMHFQPNTINLAQNDYYPYRGKVLCIGKIDTNYNGADSSVSSITMTYDTLQNLKTVKTLLNKKSSKYMETRFYYPGDYTLGGALKRMRDSGIILPVSVEKWLITPAGQMLTDMTITDFQTIDNGGIAAKNTYSLQSEAAVPLSVAGAFNPSLLNRIPSLTKLNQTVDKFDSKSISIEYTNILSQSKESIIWDDRMQVSLATVVNAGYNEIAYSSFETDNNGRWQLPVGTYIYNTCITGRKAYRFTGNISTTVTPGKKYIVTYWTTGGSAIVNGSQGVKLKTRQGWNLYSHQLDINTSSIIVTGSTLTIDELRAYPINARMTTQTPEPYLGTISSCDALNNVRYFVFDEQGRNRLEKDEFGNILSMNCYGRPNERVDCNAVYRNYEMRFPYAQKNCSAGVPDTIVYVVPAGKYTSSVSQYTVDSLGIDDANKNGQAYANSLGSCGTVYVKLVYDGVYLNSTQAVAYFYYDAACTRPRSVKNLVVNFAIEDSCQPSADTQSVVANGTYCYLASIPYFYYQLTLCDDYGNNCVNVDCYIDCVIKSGNYIIK